MKEKKYLNYKLKIGLFGKEFIPEQSDYEPVNDKLGIGLYYGEKADLSPKNLIINYTCYSKVAHIGYTKDDMFVSSFYKHGRWETSKDGMPMFHVWGLLK